MLPLIDELGFDSCLAEGHVLYVAGCSNSGGIISDPHLPSTYSLTAMAILTIHERKCRLVSESSLL